MKMWLSSQELADLGLAGLPTTKQGVNACAKRLGWDRDRRMWRRRPGAEGGGGREWNVDGPLFPAWARLDYYRREVAIADEPLRVENAADDGASLTAAAKTARDARRVIVRMADRFHAGSSLSVLSADISFADRFNSGSMPVQDWVKQAVGSISRRSIARWRAAIRRGEPTALAVDRSAARKGTGTLTRAEGGEVRRLIMGLIDIRNLSAAQIRRTVRGTFGEQLSLGDGRSAPLPSIRTFQYQIAALKIEHRHAFTYLNDPDGYRNKVRFVATGSTRAERLNEVWQIDASPADVMTTDGRPTIYAAIDIWSRRLTLLVTTTARAEAVGMLIRKAILAWGVPERIKSDNGSDFTAHWTSRLLASLGVEHEKAAPFSPDQKGVVERVIGTFQRDCARMLPGFVGHSVADRKKIEASMAFSRRLGTDEAKLFGVELTLRDLAEHADAWANDIYAHARHSTLGMSPFEKAARWTGTIRTIDDPASLDVLLARVPDKDGIRRVTRAGIRIDGTQYYIGSVMPGTDVLCRMDPADLGRLHVFNADGDTFLGHAVAPELAGVDPATAIARARAEQKAREAGDIADIRRGRKKVRPRDVAPMILRDAAERTAALIAFPKPGVDHATPAIDAAADAAAPIEAKPLTGRAAELHAELQAEPPANDTVVALPETRERRFARAIDLQRRIDAGEAVAPADALWLGGYRAGPEFKAMTTIYESFGEAALR